MAKMHDNHHKNAFFMPTLKCFPSNPMFLCNIREIKRGNKKMTDLTLKEQDSFCDSFLRFFFRENKA